MFKKLILNTIKKAVNKAISEVKPEELLITIINAIDEALESVGIDIIDSPKDKSNEG